MGHARRVALGVESCAVEWNTRPGVRTLAYFVEGPLVATVATSCRNAGDVRARVHVRRDQRLRRWRGGFLDHHIVIEAAGRQWNRIEIRARDLKAEGTKHKS